MWEKTRSLIRPAEEGENQGIGAPSFKRGVRGSNAVKMAQRNNSTVGGRTPREFPLPGRFQMAGAGAGGMGGTALQKRLSLF